MRWKLKYVVIRMVLEISEKKHIDFDIIFVNVTNHIFVIVAKKEKRTGIHINTSINSHYFLSAGILPTFKTIVLDGYLY